MFNQHPRLVLPRYITLNAVLFILTRTTKNVDNGVFRSKQTRSLTYKFKLIRQSNWWHWIDYSASGNGPGWINIQPRSHSVCEACSIFHIHELTLLNNLGPM